ncbi:oligopeptide transporter 4 [Sporothrix schenckii 1099-18]|uniref:OPT family small oligopeptide transporter n=2 Tax=Sporothrix schenckii TaxID=29908 RepID=U7Q414_SPOS1|nr:oligopeptide transporter 4 [Sporothrix schenckii 1099-18]ERT02593.1 OPT family small oligopeptide transporter [Sporothrix schenckii ATCC 58251]KJR80112.1 oligopeptide transporter 4 [Sporothrix schenckii 1099-18]
MLSTSKTRPSDGDPMTRQPPPSLRSSPSFQKPSYGAVSGIGSGTSTPTAVATAAATPTEPIHTQSEAAEAPLRRMSTGASAASTRHATLRRQRSQATSLFAQYDAVTGGSTRVPPPELEVEAMLAGLGGTRFDAAGAAAAVTAAPSEASFDSGGLDDDNDDDDDHNNNNNDGQDGLSGGYYDGEAGTVSDTGYPMLRDTDVHNNGCGSSYGESVDGSVGDSGEVGKSSAQRDPLGSNDEDDDNATSSNPPDNSPFAQVRASVAPVDNTLLSISTPRMWFLSILFSFLGSSTNLFFSLRYPSVAITPVIALLLVHPLGLAWDMVFKRADDPPEDFVDGVLVHNSGQHARQICSRMVRIRLWLSQGSWNEKEHTCVYVSSNVSFGFAFATDVIVEQTHFYKQDVSIIYQLLLIVSTQILGYTFAGLSRRFLVRPSGMIWPSTLMSAAMFATLHKEENKPANGWRISRWHFFYAVFVGAFAFYFIPGLLMPALSYFNVITWFAPRNVVVSNLFGVVSGLGLFPMTFDWAQIAYIGSPLLTPFWAAMNVVGGLVIVMWIIAPIAYYRNWLYSSFMPILSASVFDNKGQVYDVSRILTSDFLFDRGAYSNYSRVFLPITYVLSYGVQFAGLASLLTHTACWHGKDIWRQWCQSLDEAKLQTAASKRTTNLGGFADREGAYQPVPTSTADNMIEDDETDVDNPRSANLASNAVPLQSATSRSVSDSTMDGLMSHEDVHNRLMKRYRDAPMWWYLVTFVSMTAVGMFIVEYYPVHLPWYGLLLALGICAILFIPIGIVMAVTNQHVSIYLICQLVCGAMFPGRPVANMVFVTYGYISSAQGIKFCADLKLGHYMKIPPRTLFKVQMVATLVSSVSQIAVLNWMFGNIPGLCTSEALNGFICPIARVHFNGSILWGVVGPGEFFGPNAIYRPLVWCFLVGAIAPVPLWLYSRHRRDSLVRKINLPILLGSLGWIPPATGLNFSVWALVCYLFNYLVKRRATAWWAKYTMTLSAALDAALASGIVVVFFAFIYSGLATNFHWWGTEVYKQGCDWQACAYQTVPEGGRFGPDIW